MKTKYINTVRERIGSYDTRYMLIGIRGHYTVNNEWYHAEYAYGYVEYHSYNSKTMYNIR
jgi:hypothetical protein